jgi:hypothetical protein
MEARTNGIQHNSFRQPQLHLSRTRQNQPEMQLGFLAEISSGIWARGTCCSPMATSNRAARLRFVSRPTRFTSMAALAPPTEENQLAEIQKHIRNPIRVVAIESVDDRFAASNPL